MWRRARLAAVTEVAALDALADESARSSTRSETSFPTRTCASTRQRPDANASRATSNDGAGAIPGLVRCTNSQ